MLRRKRKIHFYVPQEGNAPSANAEIMLDEVPAVGDLIRTNRLSPDAGPGASDMLFRVVSRMWTAWDIPYLTVTRHRESK